MTRTQLALRKAILVIDGVTANFAEFEEYGVKVDVAAVRGEIKRISHNVNHILGEYEKEMHDARNG